MYQSTFLLRSSADNNNHFGTAFCIDKNANGSYLVSCAHVVEDCGMDTMQIDHKQAKLIAKGVHNGIDLAVVYVEGFGSKGAR